MADVDDTFTARVNASGTAVISFKVPNNRVTYTVKQVSVEYPTAPISCTCTLRKNGNFITLMIPTGDAAGGDPPIVLTESNVMTVTFASATTGDTVTATFFYDDGSGK